MLNMLFRNFMKDLNMKITAMMYKLCDDVQIMTELLTLDRNNR